LSKYLTGAYNVTEKITELKSPWDQLIKDHDKTLDFYQPNTVKITPISPKKYSDRMPTRHCWML
jgi:hypothetical protein